MNEISTTAHSEAGVRHPSRRDFLGLGVGAFVVAALPWAHRRRPHVIRRTLPVMGTTAEIAVIHHDDSYAQRAIDAAFNELRRVEALMSRFDSASDVGRANLLAGAGPVRVSAATATVLSRSLALAEATDGRFDPALGRAIALWDFGGRREPPSPDALRRYAGQRLFDQVDLGRSGGADVVLFRSPDVALDLGGIAKGYGVDRAVGALRAWGIAHGLVNAGGDLYALGRSPDGDGWEIGIRSPSDPQRLLATFQVEDQAIATSGDYQQYFEFGGRRYHHLLDPATAEPHRVASSSLTVAAADCLSADAAATALFGAPRPLAAALLHSTPGARIVHST